MGRPLLVQLFIVFYGLGQVGIKIDPVPAAILALSLNVGGYAAEIIRASILSVPRGQYEAATTIGMAYPQLLRADRAAAGGADRRTAPVQHAALPHQGHVARVGDPGPGAAETGRSTRRRRAADFMPLYLFAALYYWVVCFLVSLAQDPLEKRLGRHAA